MSAESIYHYTSIIGLDGILRDQCLRATDYRCLNDAEELNYSAELLAYYFVPTIRDMVFQQHAFVDEEVAKAIDPYRSCGSKLCKFWDKFNNDRDRLLYLESHRLVVKCLFDTLNKVVQHIFITSFCTVPPSTKPELIENGYLSMWRAYGLDGGYMIEFDKLELMNLFKDSVGTNKFTVAGSVAYTLADLENDSELKQSLENIRELVKSFIIHDLEHRPTGGWGKNISPKIDEYIPDILRLICRLKHPGFHEENEFRVVVGMDKNEKVKTITKNGMIVPYIEIFNCKNTGRKLPIKSIMVGPHRDSARRGASLRKVVDADISVKESQIPFLG